MDNCDEDGQFVIGLDPAATATGWAVVVREDGAERVVFAGVCRPEATERIAILAALYEWGRALVETWQPQAVAIEAVFHGPNAKTTILLAEVGAVLRLGVLHGGIESGRILDVRPAERLSALGLRGRATKDEVVAAINTLYGYELTDHNEADAAAVALAGLSKMRLAALGLAA